MSNKPHTLTASEQTAIQTISDLQRTGAIPRVAWTGSFQREIKTSGGWTLRRQIDFRWDKLSGALPKNVRGIDVSVHMERSAYSYASKTSLNEAEIKKLYGILGQDLSDFPVQEKLRQKNGPMPQWAVPLIKIRYELVLPGNSPDSDIYTIFDVIINGDSEHLPLLFLQGIAGFEPKLF